MKKIFKRFVPFLISIVMLSCATATAFAYETTYPSDLDVKDCITLEVTSEGIVSATNMDGQVVPMSSISGYGYSYLTSSDHAFIIYPEGSGIGGMGVTIKTSSSWNGYMSCHMFDNEGNVQFMDQAIYSNGEKYFNDLLTVNPGYYIFNFLGIPNGVAVNVWIWIYG